MYAPDDYRLDPDYDPHPQYDEDDDIDFKIDQAKEDRDEIQIFDRW